MIETMEEIGKRLGSSKWSGHSYLPVYDRLLASLRQQDFTLVEFGIDQGNSMRLWLDYFTRARIVGIDEGDANVEKVRELDPRCLPFCLMQEDPAVADVLKSYPPTVIIDDAGHRWHAQYACFLQCWPLLRPGGYYIVEDINNEIAVLPHSDAGSSVLANWLPLLTRRDLSYTIYGEHKTGFGDYRDDDILLVMKKEAL